MSGRIIGLQRQRLFEQRQGLGRLFRRREIDMRKGAQNKIIGVETVGPFALDALDLGIAQAWLDGADDTQGDLVLKREDILEPAVVTFGP